MIEKALLFGGWPGLILLLFGGLGGILYWSYLMLKRKYLMAFCCSIILFPFTFYADRTAGVLAYSIVNWDQRIGLSTLLLVSLAFALIFYKRLRRPNNRLGRTIEFLMWAFCISLTISQLATHSPFSAIALSIGAAWQFLILFYLLISLIEHEKDLLSLLNAIFVCSILNILIRFVAKGESLIINLSSQTAGVSESFGAEAGRIGSGAFGPAVSYAVYLAIFITLALGVFLLTKRKIYLLYLAIMGVELLNTFTRGGIFVLFLLPLLILFRSNRLSVLIIGFWVVLIVATFSGFIWDYLSVRGFTLNVLSESNFALRVVLIEEYFNQYYVFSIFGNGILNNTVVKLTPWLSVPVHNTYLEVLDTCGLFPLAIFTAISLYSVYISIRICKRGLWNSTQGRGTASLKPFFLVALIQWIVFANTTSTSILAYYPYEGTAVFWIVCLSSFVFANFERRTNNLNGSLCVGTKLTPQSVTSHSSV